MGLYIKCDVMKGKAKWLRNQFPSIETTTDPYFDLLHRFLVVAVVDTPAFDSAVVMEDEALLHSTFNGDPRNIEWLVVPKDVIANMVERNMLDETALKLIQSPPPVPSFSENREIT